LLASVTVKAFYSVICHPRKCTSQPEPKEEEKAIQAALCTHLHLSNVSWAMSEIEVC